VPLPRDSVARSAQLLAALHLTDGKVGAAAAWRTLVDDAVGSAWECLREMGGAKGASNGALFRLVVGRCCVRIVGIN
jgi:hypothetical protein